MEDLASAFLTSTQSSEETTELRHRNKCSTNVDKRKNTASLMKVKIGDGTKNGMKPYFADKKFILLVYQVEILLIYNGYPHKR